MKQVGLYEAKSSSPRSSRLLLSRGDPVSLTKHGQVVAELRLPSSGTPSRGSFQGDNFYISPEFDHPKPLSPPSPPRVDPPQPPEDEPRQ